VKYEYAVNRSDTEYYRRRRGRQKFQYYHNDSLSIYNTYDLNDCGWQNAGSDTWKHWVTPERTRPLPNSAILLLGISHD
jgi:hypothetical protein